MEHADFRHKCLVWRKRLEGPKYEWCKMLMACWNELGRQCNITPSFREDMMKAWGIIFAEDNQTNADLLIRVSKSAEVVRSHIEKLEL